MNFEPLKTWKKWKIQKFASDILFALLWTCFELISRKIEVKMKKLSAFYLKGRNFRGQKISRISRILAKVAKLNSFFEPRKIRFAKINSREISQKLFAQ